MEEFFSGIGNYGFHIVLSGYLLMRLEQKLDRLTESIWELSKNLKSN
ncbi:MAG: YvrJ family protein [Filifactoraceae bacterium]